MVVDETRAREWLSKGAQPSDTVRRLFAEKGLCERGPIPTTKRAPKNAEGRVTMSAFDDEFGLFGETVRRTRSQAEAAKRAASDSAPVTAEKRAASGAAVRETRPPAERIAPDPWAGHRRATELLGCLARKLVQKPDEVTVELFIDETAQAVIELVVDPEVLAR